MQQPFNNMANLAIFIQCGKAVHYMLKCITILKLIYIGGCNDLEAIALLKYIISTATYT